MERIHTNQRVSGQSEASRACVEERSKCTGCDYSDRRCWSLEVANERPGRLCTEESTPEGDVIVIARSVAATGCSRITKRCGERLHRRIPLSRSQNIVCRECPSAKDVSNYAVLLLEERQLLGNQDCALMGNIQSGKGVFAFSGVQRVLRERDRAAAGKCAEDFAHVVQVLGPRITGPHGQLLEKVVGAKFRLQGVVVGVAAVVSGAHYTGTAMESANVSWAGGSGVRRNLLRYRARRLGYQVRVA